MYSSTLKVVNDPALDREFGARLAENIRASVHAGGDCRVCGKEIRNADKVRIDTQAPVAPTMHIYSVRHASCKPSTEGLAASILTDHTYTYRFFGWEFTQSKPQTWLDRLLRRAPGEEKTPFIGAVVHPGVDGMPVVRGADGNWPETLQAMFEAAGFGHLGDVDMPKQPSPGDPFTAEREHGRITLRGQNQFIGSTYSEVVPAGPVQAHLDASAGVMLGMATVTDPNQIPDQEIPLLIPEFRDEVRYAWLPFSDREDNS